MVLIFTILWFLGIGIIIASPAELNTQEVKLSTQKGVISLNEFNGQVIYVDFWASWCGPCRKSFPWMNEMQARYQDKSFKIIAINVENDPELAKRVLAQHPLISP